MTLSMRHGPFYVTWSPRRARPTELVAIFGCYVNLAAARGGLSEKPPLAGRVATRESAAPQRAHLSPASFRRHPLPCRRLIPLDVIHVMRSTIVARPPSRLSLGLLLAAPRNRADVNKAGGFGE